jgi:hypothetical protein
VSTSFSKARSFKTEAFARPARKVGITGTRSTRHELAAFRKLATELASVSEETLSTLLSKLPKKKRRVKICHVEFPEIQERRLCGDLREAS